MTTTAAWLKAFRLRTLPLAFSSIIMGAFLAAREGFFQWPILLLTLVTTLFLQVLSNLANDYGDFIKGTDNSSRVGPSRTVQEGLISPQAMKKAMVLFSLLAFGSGLSLLYQAGIFSDLQKLLFFVGLGVFCIAAAITYTVGNNAYGYKGLGDISVLLFFGAVGVLGTTYLMTSGFKPVNLLLAFSCGLLATGVLNLNNLRDIENDAASGKRSIPVMIGFVKGKFYQYSLVIGSFLLLSSYTLVTYQSAWQLLFVLLTPLYVLHIYQVHKTKENRALDKFLKQLALLSLATTFLTGIGIILSNQ